MSENEFKILCVVGFKNSGKTTMVRRIVENLTNKNYKISTIKHAHHGFDIDQPGRDSFLHRKAGAHEVVIMSSERFALLHEYKDDEDVQDVEAILKKMSPCDLVVVEGFRHYNFPKIEVRRSVSHMRPLDEVDENIIAMASDHKISGSEITCFDINDIENISNFVIERFKL